MFIQDIFATPINANTIDKIDYKGLNVIILMKM